MNTQTTAKDAGRLPSRLSPSRMSDFRKCRKSFHFRSILGLPTQPTEAQVKGTVVHTVLENLFTLARVERTIEAALGLVDPALNAALADERYRDLWPTVNPESFRNDVETLVRQYFDMEDPTGFDPDGQELWVHGNVSDMPLVGVIDRLDRVTLPDGSVRVFVSDYKTGKVPRDRYRAEAFFAMRVYSLLLAQAGERAHRLRLIYLKEGNRNAVLRHEVTDEDLVRIEAEVASIVEDIRDAFARDHWPTNVGPLCSWCDYQSLCPAFAADSTPNDGMVRVSPWRTDAAGVVH